MLLKLILEHPPGWIIDESRREWILDAIRLRDLDFLRILTETVDPFLHSTECVELAAGIENNVAVIDYLVSLDCPIHHSKTFIAAIKNRNFKNMNWMLKNGFSFDDCRIFEAAANNGSLDVLKWFKRNGCWFTTKMKSTGENCSIETLEWLKQQGPLPFEHQTIFKAAAKQGCIDKMEWLLSNGCLIENSVEIYQAAARWKF